MTSAIQLLNFPFNCIVGGNSDSRLSLCFVAIRRSLLQEETDAANAITGELNGTEKLALKKAAYFGGFLTYDEVSIGHDGLFYDSAAEADQHRNHLQYDATQNGYD